MSLRELPTELFSMIASFLYDGQDFRALDQLSRTSKNLRNIAEPWLYHDIVLQYRNWHMLGNLMLTLLDRPELALHIRRVRVIYTQITSFPTTERYKFHLDCSATARGLSVRHYHVKFKEQLCSIFDGIVGVRGLVIASSRVGRRPPLLKPSFDHSVALILGMATQQRYIKIDKALDWMPFTQQLLGAQWESDDVCPFMHLYVVHIIGHRQSCRAVTILPSMREVTIEGRFLTLRTLDQQPGHAIPAPTNPELAKLKLESMLNVDSSLLVQLIASPWLRNLKTFEIIRCCEWNDVDRLFDLVRAMGKALPYLQDFTWCSQKLSHNTRKRPPSHHFRDLKNLKYLVIDIDLLVPQASDTFTSLSNFHMSNSLPQSLEHLTLANLKSEVEHDMVAAFLINDTMNLQRDVYFYKSFVGAETLPGHTYCRPKLY